MLDSLYRCIAVQQSNSNISNEVVVNAIEINDGVFERKMRSMIMTSMQEFTIRAACEFWICRGCALQSLHLLSFNFVPL